MAKKARSKAKKCASPWCRNERAVNNTGYTLKFCWKCRSRQLKERHPETYVLNALRQRARARKIPFTITLVQFRKFCQDTDYLSLRGREPDSATIGRINHDEGYHIWNIQIESHAENSEDGHTVPGKATVQNQSQPSYPQREEDYTPPDPEYTVSEGCPF